MPEQKSALVYSKAIESEQKFDYFVATITGAIVAYSLQSYDPTKWNWNAQTLEPIALITLFISFFLGLMRIQTAVGVIKHNTDSLRFGELANDLKNAYENGTQGCIEPGTGIEYNRPQMPELFRRYQGHEISSNAAGKQSAVNAQKYYLWRNRLLIFGFGILLFSKILAPYWN